MPTPHSGERPSPASPRCAAYIRVSTQQQVDEGLSLGDQERRISEHVRAQGGVLTGIYADRGVSGRKDDRPELQRLLGDLDGIDLLVVTRLDRLGRNTRHLLVVLHRLAEAGVGFVSLADSIDTTTPGGRFLQHVLAAVAEFESDIIGGRMSAMMEARARAGKHHGRLSYGFRLEGRQLVHDRAEAEVVRRVFAEYVGGASHDQIARGLDADGIRPQRAGSWARTSIAKLLRNVEYVGEVRGMDQKVFDGEHEPIIDTATWQAAQRRREARRGITGTPGRTPAGRHLFTAEVPLVCECGHRMEPRSDRRKDGSLYEVYRCPGKRKGTCSMPVARRTDIDTEALRYFIRRGLDVDATRAAIAEGLNRQIAEARQLRAQAELDEQRATDRHTRVMRDYQDGHLDAVDWGEQRTDLVAERDAAREEADRHRAREAEVAAVGAGVDAEQDAYERIAEVYRQVIGSVRRWGVAAADGKVRQVGHREPSAEEVPPLRAALAQVFERFVLRHDPLGELPQDPDTPWTGERGEFVLEPNPRGQVADAVDGALKRVPLPVGNRHKPSRLCPPAAASSSARLASA